MPIDLVATTDLNAQLFADRHSAEALSRSRSVPPTEGPSFESQFASMMQTQQEIRERPSSGAHMRGDADSGEEARAEARAHEDATARSSHVESTAVATSSDERRGETSGAQSEHDDAMKRKAPATAGENGATDRSDKGSGSAENSQDADAAVGRDESVAAARKTDAAVAEKRAAALIREADARRGERVVDWDEVAERKLSRLRQEQLSQEEAGAAIVHETATGSTAEPARAGDRSPDDGLAVEQEPPSVERTDGQRASDSTKGGLNRAGSNPAEPVKAQPEAPGVSVAATAAQADRVRENAPNSKPRVVARADLTAAADSPERLLSDTPESRSVRAGKGEAETSEPRVVVVDLRDRAKGGGDERGGAEPRVSGDPSRNVGALKTADSGRSQSDTGTDLFRSFDPSPAGARATGQDGARQPAPSFEGLRNALVQQLRENGNTEIVRQAQFVLRNNDSGQIRLTLKPEHLGSVRISLNVHDGHIGGRIIVENTTVKEVFDQNLGELSRAFQQQGLQTGSLEVSVANSGGEHGRQEGSRSGRWVVRHLKQAVPLVYETQEEHDLVNLVV